MELNNILDSFLNKCGLSIPINMEDSNFLENLAGITHSPAAKSLLLPYRYYCEKDKLYINENNSAGFILEVAPQVGVSLDNLKQLEAFLKDQMPFGSTLQVMLLASSNIEHHFTKYLRSKEPVNSDHADFLLRRVDYLRSISKKEKNLDLTVRDFRCFFSFSFENKSEKELKTTLVLLKKQLHAVLKSSNMPALELDPQLFLNLINEILNWEVEEKKYNPRISLSQQLVNRNKPLLDYGSEILSKGRKTRLFSVKKLPKEEYTGCMSTFIGDHLRDNLNIPGNFLFSYIIKKDISNLQTRGFLSKGESVIKSATGFLSRFNPNLQEEAKEWLEVKAGLENGEPVFSTCFQIMLSDTETGVTNIDDAEQNIRSLFSINHWEVEREEYMTLEALLNMLPMVAGAGTFEIMKYFQYCKTAKLDEILALLPMYGEWKGTQEAGMLLVGKKGQLMHFTPFDTKTAGNNNANTTIIAPSGGGKSVTSQELVFSLLAQNVQVFVFDIGKSYLNLCKLLGGEFIEFSLTKDFSLNFFSNISGTQADIDEFLDSASRIVISMASPSGKLNDLGRSIVSTAVRETWNKYRQDTTITKIIEELRLEGSKEAFDISRMLMPYSASGIYGKYFEKKSTINFNNRFIVYEFEEIRNKPDLINIVMQIFTAQTSQKFTGNRSKRFAMLFDEFNGYGEILQDQVSWLARAIRKYGGMLVTISQNYSDFQKNEFVKTIWKSSDWHIYLPHGVEKVRSLREEEGKKLSGPFLDLLGTAKLVKSKYSEIVITSEKVSVIGRLILDPHSNLLFSTESDDFNRAKTLRESGMESAIEIIDTMLKERHQC